MSREGLVDKYGPFIRVPPLLIMDAVLSGHLVLGNSDEFPVVVALVHFAVVLNCALLFFLPTPTISYCYMLIATAAAIHASRWWNAVFLHKLGIRNLTSATVNVSAERPFGVGGSGDSVDDIGALEIVVSDEFLLYLCVQLMYSFVFAVAPAVVGPSSMRSSSAPLLAVWTCLTSPVLALLLLQTVQLLPAHRTTELVIFIYFIYPFIPLFLLNVLLGLVSRVYYYVTNVRFIVRSYFRVYVQFGLPTLLENQWVRLQVPTVLRLFWLVRFGIHIGQLIVNHQYAHQETNPDEGLLSETFKEVAVHSCSSMVAVLGLSATISPVANGIGNLARLFIGGDRDGGENIGTVSSVLFFILALQTGLPDLSPEHRVVRLARNLSLLSTAVLHFIHTMLHGIMMQLSTNHVVNKQRHARALVMAATLIVLPICFIARLWLVCPVGTWMLALTAFCIELIVKVTVTIIVYVLFFVDTQRETFWEGLDDYVYYVKAAGSTIEFVSGIFLFVNGAWIFVFESRGLIRAVMICIHAYFNIFQLGKDGWKKFQNRRLAVLKIQSLERASGGALSQHDDVCAICYQELRSACVTPCGHLFHAMCLRKWLYMQDSCPLCHKEIMVSSSDADTGSATAEQQEILHQDD